MSNNEVLKRGVMIVHLPIAYCPEHSLSLISDGLTSGRLGVRMCRNWMSKELIVYSKSARGRPFYRHATLLRLLRVHDGNQSSH